MNFYFLKFNRGGCAYAMSNSTTSVVKLLNANGGGTFKPEAESKCRLYTGYSDIPCAAFFDENDNFTSSCKL